MPTYAYEPAPYNLSGLSISSLPNETQKYLQEIGLSSSKGVRETMEAVDRVRQREEARFHRTLLGVHATLVEYRRKLAGIACTGKDGSNRFGTKLYGTIDEIESHVEKTLIPEMRSHYEGFISRMDALVWFEMTLRAGTEDAVPEEKEIEYRVLKHTPALRAADERLRGLHDSVLRGNVGGPLKKRIMRGIENRLPNTC
ncbi:hypothetical protein BDZ94DRAFT_1235991 [Collybia nuda]|uniref:Uncharacterized protein n=1 Tax=Collybia nuda TaxID=64659 RepID=A0A9P6CFA1_9AGAR|nr:hypothetical protein BDZ94DRAFT_1235991 [Collybia nuda]